MTPLPKVGIILSAYPTPNWERDLPRCLASLERIDYPKDRIELLCFESKGKREPVKPWFDEHWLPKSGASLPRITYVFNDAWIGFAGNNNLCLEEAKKLGCDYVYLLNQDTDTEPDFLRRAVERAERDPRVGIVQSLMLLGEERDRVNSLGNAWHVLGVGYSLGYRWTRAEAEAYLAAQERQDPERHIAYASGAAMLARISALDQAGGLFDERFFLYHEDTDTSLRLRIQGWKVVLEPRSVIYHYYEFNKAKVNYYWMERNRWALLLIYLRPWTLFLLSPLLLAFEVALVAFSVLRGWGDMKWKMAKEWFTRDYWRWIGARRREMQERRLLGDRQFLRASVAEIQFQEPSVRNPLLDKVGNPVMRAYWAVVRHLI